MKRIDVLLLLVLSAIWGASFLFMRVASPEFGPVTLVFIRMFVAVLVVLPFLLKPAFRKALKDNAKNLAILGFLNHVIPFTLLSFATLRLEAGFTSLINATTPMFTAIVGALFFVTPINRQQMLGLVIAFLGVFVLSADKLSFSADGPGWAIIAGLVATFCYGLSVNFSKTKLNHLSASQISVGSMAASSLILLIPGILLWPSEMPTTQAWVSALLLAVVCTALAFLLFFRVLASSGAIASSTVTFLVPLFAIGWGVLLLNESLTVRLIIGMCITLCGTAITVQIVRLSNPFVKSPKLR
jgi:drug/metabolite transporter (DMT)-like permease